MVQPGFFAAHPELENRLVLVIGGGRSGRAAAALAAGRGASVILADARPEDRLPARQREKIRSLEEKGIRVRFGGHPASVLESAGIELLVLSPGVSGDVPIVTEALRRGVPVWGEIELASRFLEGKVIGITGSNGKSTVTTMAGAILRAAGIPGGVGGNLDTPLAELLELDGPEAVHSVELSSFQLETVDAFDPEVAVLLNLSPDHLDRYPDFEAYARAKGRLLEVQSSGHAAVLNADDPASERFLSTGRAARHLFSLRSEPEQGAFLRAGRIVLRTSHGEETVMAASELPVPGEHNLANALAAALACRLAGCPAEAVAAGLRTFRPLAHRLQEVGTVRGVKFYNDSKATNLDATVQAIRSFPAGTIHLILGGKDKGGDWPSLVPLLAERVRTVLLVGEAAEIIAEALGGAVPWIHCGTMAEAVRAGWKAAGPGDVILLSPGCASFDQYPGFQARGDDFIRAVEKIDHA